MISSVRALAGFVCLSVAATAANAQVIGTFRWQTAPFCNVVTLTVTQQPGGVFTLDGFDDQCGASRRAAASGMAVPNPDGTIGLGFTIVHAPGATPVHVTVPVSLATLDGTWRDSAGQSGPFRFTPGVSIGGRPRPTTGTLAAAVILPSTSDGAFDLSSEQGVVARHSNGGSLLWLAAKRALRAGVATGEAWADARVGVDSAAFGRNTVASAATALAAGEESVAAGENSLATGFRSTASGVSSAAFGFNTQATGVASTAFGSDSRATGHRALAGGDGSVAQGDDSLAIGFRTTATGVGAVALGSETVASGPTSVALGKGAVANTSGSFVYGDGSHGVLIESALPNQFLVRAAGGTVFWSTSNATFGSGPGVVLFSGASAWAAAAPAAARENARDLDGEGVLGKIALMPVRTWNYKAQPASIRHAGPTAEDFHAAFGLGDDPRYISTTDADGIGFAAIQALDARTRRLSETDDVLSRENGALRRENEALRQMLAALVERLDHVERLATERLTADERK